ncbi:unnamed protein product [Closterium sp. NIES-64]|nr:unnamed protein product [Closterium sp. NIES-64]
MMTQRQEDATWHNQHSDAQEFEEQNGAPGNGSGRRREQEASETSHELSYLTGVAADRAERGVGLRKGQGCGGGRGDVAREGRASEWGRERGVSVGEAREKGVSVRVESGRGVSGRRDYEEEEEEEEAKEGEKEHVVEVVGEEKDEEEEEGEDEAGVIEVSDTDGESEEQGKEEGQEEGGEGGGGEGGEEGGGDGGEEEEVYGSVEEADVDCPICGCHLSHLEPIRREQHSNACLDAWGRDRGEEEETETCKMGADTDARGRDRGEEEAKMWRTRVGGRVKGTGETREESGERVEEEGAEGEEGGEDEERGEGGEGEEGEDANSAMARMLWKRIDAGGMGMTMGAWRRRETVGVRGEECEGEEEEREGKGKGEKGRGKKEMEDMEETEEERQQAGGQSGGNSGDVSGGLSGAVGAQKKLITDFFGGGNRHRPRQQQQRPQQQQAPGAAASLAEVSRGHQQGAGRGVKWGGGRFAGRGGSGSAGRGGMSKGRGGGWHGGRGRGGVSLPEAWEMIPGTDFLVVSAVGYCDYNGLTKSFRFGTVYCSAVTARLVKLRLGLPEEKICELPVGERVEIAGVGVTLMDANHCPGAVMILFEPPNGQAVLHTGDFRWHPSMAALPCLAATSIHTLILDTTYCHPKGVLENSQKQPSVPPSPLLNPTTPYEFPPQEAALQFVVEAIQAETSRWTQSNPFDPYPSNSTPIHPTMQYEFPPQEAALQFVYEFPPQEAALQFVVEAIQAEAFNTSALFLIGTYTIGKEKVFLEAAKALKRKVYVGAVKRRLLACLGLSHDDMAWVAGDGEEASTNLHAVPLWSISSFKRIEHIAKFHRQRYSTIIAFSPSGWAFDKCKKARPIRRTQRGTIVRYEVPYSEHSSFYELQECVKAVNPEVIIPSVHNRGHGAAQAMVTLLAEEQSS